MCQKIDKKLETEGYKNEGEFVRNLDEEEMAYLDSVLERELAYARNVENDIRVKELTEVYELLF